MSQKYEELALFADLPPESLHTQRECVDYATLFGDSDLVGNSSNDTVTPKVY